MKSKLLILLLSLLTWGWFNQQWLVSAVLITVISLSLLTSWRWQISQQQFHRIGDLATVIIVLGVLYGVFAQTEQKTVFIILKWLPVFFAPVLFAQLFSTLGKVPLGVLFYSVRKRSLNQVSLLDFKIPFSGLCLLSAGAANDQTPAYFIVTVSITVLILWAARSRYSSIIIWSMVILTSSGIAFSGQQGLRALHTIIEEKAVDWLSDWQTDPFKTSTSIGDIGELKMSDRIEYRIKAGEPLLLHQSSYDRYMGQSWYASRRMFNSRPSQEMRPNGKEKQLVIFQQAKRESILALPAGTVAITGLEGAILQYNDLGAVKLSEAPEFVRFQVRYTGQQTGKTGRYDLDIPKQHLNWIELIKQDLKLENQPAKIIAQTITRYFQKNYYYTLFLGANTDADKALQDFMLKRKAGHCEYFAVASVFLLRSYGIPARLVNGYAMREYDAAEKMFIVRRRHAHAWASAYINGNWQPVDATPSQWLNIEEESADPFQSLYDWFSSLSFAYKNWRYQQTLSNSKDNGWWIGIAIVLAAYLAWRLYSTRRQMTRQKKQIQSRALQNNDTGKDSELYLIEQALSNTENARLNNESVAEWAKRMNDKALIAIAKKHYGYRFDPAGISAEHREQLKQDVKSWLNINHV